MVMEYHRTRDPLLLERLCQLRDPTLRYMASHNACYAPSEDEMLSDLRLIWLKCIERYDGEARLRPMRTRSGGRVRDEDGGLRTVLRRTPFNTFLYTAMRNYVANMIKGRYSRKRADDNGVPYDVTTMSLDFDYGIDNPRCRDPSDGLSYHEVLADPDTSAFDRMSAEMMIDAIADGDAEIKEALRSYAYDRHVRRISTACRHRTGVVPLSSSERAIMTRGGAQADELLISMIQRTNRYPRGFRVTSYKIQATKIAYEVRVKDRSLQTRMKKVLDRAKRLMLSTGEHVKETH